MRNGLYTGFTLIEMAIVVAIMAVLLAGVFQGRELIANAEYRAFKKSLHAYHEAFQAFRERYKALPGDFAEATERLSSSITAGPSSQGNGVIDDGPGCNAANSESCLAWQHLRAAGLVNGAIDAPPPEHPYAGRFGGFFTSADGNGVFGHKLRVDSVPGEVARRLDDELDDGRCDHGRISMATTTGTSCGSDWPQDTDVDLVYAL